MQYGAAGHSRSILQLKPCPSDHYWGKYEWLMTKCAPNAHLGGKGLKNGCTRLVTKAPWLNSTKMIEFNQPSEWYFVISCGAHNTSRVSSCTSRLLVLVAEWTTKQTKVNAVNYMSPRGIVVFLVFGDWTSVVLPIIDDFLRRNNTCWGRWNLSISQSIWGGGLDHRACTSFFIMFL